MSKNKIIPQMFDVRPVNATGVLDLEKIESIKKHSQDIELQKQQKIKIAGLNSKVRTYILGIGIENDKAPVFHDPNFFLEKQSSQLKKNSNALEERLATTKYIAQKKEAAIIAERIRSQEKEKQQIEREKFQRAKEVEETARHNYQKQIRYNESIKTEKRRLQEEKEKQIKAEVLQKKEFLKEKMEHDYQQQILYAKQIKEKKDKEQKEAVLKEKLRIEIEGRNKKYQKKAIFYANKRRHNFFWKNLFSMSWLAFQFNTRSFFAGIAMVFLVLLLGAGGVFYISKNANLKGSVLGVSLNDSNNLSAVIKNISTQNFEYSTQQFSETRANFEKILKQIDFFEKNLPNSKYLIVFNPKDFLKKNIMQAHGYFLSATQSFNNTKRALLEVAGAVDASTQTEILWLNAFKLSEKNLIDAKKELEMAQQSWENILASDLPKDKQSDFLSVKQEMINLQKDLTSFLNSNYILVDLLGGNGSRKYLFLLQDNSEIRASGGHIESYGLLDVNNGCIKKFLNNKEFDAVNDQLQEKIVPPKPLQEISATWNLSESNWFPDFPLSAQKALYFYEKTADLKPDGVIAFTPVLLKKLLEITGPIEMSDYDETLDANNFTKLLQKENDTKSEIDCNEKDNQSQKILNDLIPIIFEKLLTVDNLETVSKTVAVFLSEFKEKQIMLYVQNKDLEKIISDQGWSGEIILTDRDYLSVINTNINSFKNNTVMLEKINHQAEIKSDGSIVDTLTITRQHTGGDFEDNCLNKVNADYLRVYVPEGAKLLEASGQVHAIDKPPLNYDSLNFKRDHDVQNEESSAIIDLESGTRIYNEKGKTVFANWIYTNPKETSTLVYKYLLPFSFFNISSENVQQRGVYSLAVQKQSGSFGSSFESQINYPAEYNLKWNFPDKIEKSDGKLENKTNLTIDRFEGVIFEKE